MSLSNLYSLFRYKIISIRINLQFSGQNRIDLSLSPPIPGDEFRIVRIRRFGGRESEAMAARSQSIAQHGLVRNAIYSWYSLLL